VKVTITDKEALAALSWQALRTYLNAAGWKHIDDVTDKAEVYEAPGKNGRRREILVPLRRDLADYVSRMADAVTLLARVEDRSELEVYEDLRALGAGSQPLDDATRAVHEKIRRWLAEEGWHVRDVDDPQSSFNVMATLQGDNAPNVNIFQYREHFDHITLSQHWTYDHKFQLALDQLSEDRLDDILWNIYRDVVMMGVAFSGVDTPTTEMTIRAYVYFDGLTKDTLIQKILLTIRAVSLAAGQLIRALGDQSQSEDHMSPPESRIFTREELKKMMRVQPKTDDPLTITG
jgi:hypothetical protein